MNFFHEIIFLRHQMMQQQMPPQHRQMPSNHYHSNQPSGEFCKVIPLFITIYIENSVEMNHGLISIKFNAFQIHEINVIDLQLCRNNHMTHMECHKERNQWEQMHIIQIPIIRIKIKINFIQKPIVSCICN